MMKKIISAIFFTAMLFTACGALKIADVTLLDVGMTQSQVNNVLGSPVRTLSTKYYGDDVEQTFEYHTSYYEAYALTFWNGRLSAYEFMHEIAPPATISPIYRPMPSRPIYPNRPIQPNRPNRPTQPSRPTEPSRPTTRPEVKPESGNTGNTGGRPTYGQGSSRPTYTKQDGSTTKQEETKTKEEEKKKE